MLNPIRIQSLFLFLLSMFPGMSYASPLLDFLPEELHREENRMIDAIRNDPKNDRPYLLLCRHYFERLMLGMAGERELVLLVDIITTKAPLNEGELGWTFLTWEVTHFLSGGEQGGEMLESLATKFPDSTDSQVLRLKLGAWSHPKESMDTAMQAMKEGVQLDALVIPVVEALISLAEKERTSAGEQIEKFSKVYPHRWLHHFAALSFLEEKRERDAKASLQKAMQLGNRVDSPLLLARLHLRSDQGRHASLARELLFGLTSELDKRKVEEPEFRRLLSTLIAATDVKQGRTEKALKNLKHIFAQTEDVDGTLLELSAALPAKKFAKFWKKLEPVLPPSHQGSRTAEVPSLPREPSIPNFNPNLNTPLQQPNISPMDNFGMDSSPNRHVVI